MRFDYQLTQGQPNAAAADLRRLAEFKHLRPLFRRYAGSGVCEPQNQLVGVLAGGYLDGAALWLSFHGIAQKVVETLAQARAVALDGHGPGANSFLTEIFFDAHS